MSRVSQWRHCRVSYRFGDSRAYHFTYASSLPSSSCTTLVDSVNFNKNSPRSNQLEHQPLQLPGSGNPSQCWPLAIVILSQQVESCQIRIQNENAISKSNGEPVVHVALAIARYYQTHPKCRSGFSCDVISSSSSSTTPTQDSFRFCRPPQTYEQRRRVTFQADQSTFSFQ